MSRPGDHASGENPRRQLTLDIGRPARAAGMFAASFVLVAPIVMWARLGDGGALRTVAVGVAATSACWGVARIVSRRYASESAPQRTTPARGPAAAALARVRRHRLRPIQTSRSARNVGCAAGARALGSRASRRRTRP